MGWPEPPVAPSLMRQITCKAEEQERRQEQGREQGNRAGDVTSLREQIAGGREGVRRGWQVAGRG